MKICYKERLESLKNIDKYIELYHIPCAESCIDFINRFVSTFDPRKQEQNIPFELFPKQEELIHWMWELLANKQNGAVDKARDVGVTWTFLAFSWYLFYFQKKSIYLYSYKADAVDLQKRMDTLFGKLNHIYQYLPIQMKDGVKVSHMLISNGISEIAGLSGDEPRGGRASLLIKDEAAFYEHPEQVESALGEYADCIIDVSTHNGTDSLFFQKVTSGGIPIFIFDWFENLNHTKELYDKKREEAVAKGMLSEFEREINRNPYASLPNVVIPYEYVQSVRKCDYINNGKKRAGLDLADQGDDTNALCIMDGNELIYLEEWGDLEPDESVEKAFWICVDHEVEEYKYDSCSIGAGRRNAIRKIQNENKDREKELIDRMENVENEEQKKAIEKELKRCRVIYKMVMKGFNAAGKVVNPTEIEYGDKMNKDMFENIKAQASFYLRSLFLNTHRYVNNEKHDLNKVITFKSFGNVTLYNKFAKEISQPLHKLSMSGKIVIDKKAGGKSPNLYDCLMIALANVEEEWINWTIL
jgi:phage terminase large subunit